MAEQRLNEKFTFIRNFVIVKCIYCDFDGLFCTCGLYCTSILGKGSLMISSIFFLG